jgi:hypothetical protein
MESLVSVAIMILAALVAALVYWTGFFALLWALIEKHYRRAPFFALAMLFGLSLSVGRIFAALHTLGG